MTRIPISVRDNPADALPWHPIEELRNRHQGELLLKAPELVDLDCNREGVGLGYWQDDGLTWAMSQKECDKLDRDKDYGCFMACQWSMTNDEWAHVPVTPTHFIVLAPS
jgi:hypothetical protein